MITGKIDMAQLIFNKSESIFLNPLPTYKYNSIVLGCDVYSHNGRKEKMYAVGQNTWRGFHKINKQGIGAGTVFKSYFTDNRSTILTRLKTIDTSEQLDALEDDIRSDIQGNLKNIRQDMLSSYNKIRKPIDLYIEHLVAMASEMDGYREKLTRLLFLPLDSQMFQSPNLFTDTELQINRLKRNSSFKDVSSKNQYKMLQEILLVKANTLCNELSGPFHRIYFDLLWNDRYLKNGSNLFLTNM